MQARADDLRRDGVVIALVPTMGFLHDGHLALLREGRARCDELVLSIFVNPTQFGEGEDLDRYPRDEAGDLDKAQRCGVDTVFAPDAGSMYEPGYQTYVSVRHLSEPLCGARRPGHFDGVASVVTKLLNICKPQVAVFGEKDYQQLAVIRRMVIDLSIDVEVVRYPIVREPDGLALSSRNRYLSDSERASATCLFQGLEAARNLAHTGERDAAKLVTACREVIEREPEARIDYVELRDATTLETVDRLEPGAQVVLALAVFFSDTRLIDNARLSTK
jgi:pantoate--beta-alanine ligase